MFSAFVKLYFTALLCMSCAAQELSTLPLCNENATNRPCVIGVVLPDSPLPRPPAHRFFDAGNVASFLASATAIGTEAGMSCNAQLGAGPVDVKVCHQVMIGAAATLGLEVLAAGIAHHTHHHSLERLAGPAGIAFHVGRMVWISTHRK